MAELLLVNTEELIQTSAVGGSKYYPLKKKNHYDEPPNTIYILKTGSQENTSTTMIIKILTNINLGHFTSIRYCNST